MPRGTGHGQVKGLSSTYSKDGKGNRFRYQNFGERVAKAKFEARVAPRQIDIYHERKDDENLCYFKEELQRWKQLNVTSDFKAWAWKISPLVQTLPQLIHHLGEIVNKLVDGIKTVSELSLEPLFGLTAVLARDLRGEILPYFKQIFLAIVGLMDNSKPELMGLIFQTLSILFKYLSKEMLQDLTNIRELYFGLLTERKEQLRSFAAESWAFLLRKLKGKELRTQVRSILFALTVDSLNSPTINGVGRVLFELVRSSQHSLHSNTNDVMQAALVTLRKGFNGNNTNNDDDDDDNNNNNNNNNNNKSENLQIIATIRFNAIAEGLNEICKQTSRQNFHIIWKILLDEIEYINKKWEKKKKKISKNNSTISSNNVSTSLETKLLQMSRILKLVETCLNYRNGTRLSTSSEYPRLLAIMLHRLFVEHSQLTFSNTTLSSSALNLLLSLCNWFPASDMIEITKRLPDIFYRINANRNVHNIDLIHKFYENVLEKSYERPKIFTILIVPAIQFYDMMHSINCEKNVNIAFNMLCRIGRQTTNLPENERNGIPITAINPDGKLRIKQIKNDDSINDMTTETLYGKLILTLKKFTGLKGRKILDLLNDDVNESLAKEIYSAIHLFSYVILNDPTNIIQLLNGCIMKVNKLLLQDKENDGLNVEINEKLHVLKARSIIAIVNLNVIREDSISSMIGGREETLKWGLLNPVACKNEEVLKAVSLYLSNDVVNNDDISNVIGLEPAVESLRENLLSESHSVRVSTLKILSKYPKLDFITQIDNDKDDIDQQLKGPCDIIELLLRNEVTPLDLNNERQRNMLIDRIGAMVRSKYVPKVYTSLVMYSSLGMFFVKYSRVWPMINNIFPILAKNDWDMFWTIIHRQLLKIRSKITMTKKVDVLAVVDENEDEGEESADEGEDAVMNTDKTKMKVYANKNKNEIECLDDIINNHTDFVKYEELLFEALQTISSHIERKCVLMFPMFEDFLENEYDKVKMRSKDSTKKLILYLKLFATFSKKTTANKNQTVMLKMYNTYKRFLSNTNEEISLYALRCLFTYGQESLTAYRSELERIVGDKTFREQMSSFTLSRSNEKIKEEARPLLSSVVIRLSYGKLMSRKGKSGKDTVSGRRATVLTFLSGLDIDELNELYDLLLEPFKDVLKHGNGIATVNQTKQMGFIRMMEDVMEQLGIKVLNRLSDITTIIMRILHPLVSIKEREESIDSRNGDSNTTLSHDLRTLRSQAFKRLSEIFLNFPTVQHEKTFLKKLRELVLQHISTLQKTVVGQSKTASSFLELILSFSYSESLSTFMFYKKGEHVLEQTIRALSHCSTDSRNPSINYIFDIFENLLNKNVEILEPLIPIMLEEFYLRFQNMKDNLKSCKRDLFIVSSIAAVMIEKSVSNKNPETRSLCSKVVALLVPFLRPQHRLADDVKCNIIETVDALAQLVDDFSEHIGLMSRLFKPGNGMLTRQSRTKLAKLFVTIGSLPKTNWLKDTAKLIKELTAYNDHTIDSFDYDKRLGAMTVLSKNSLMPYTCKPPCVQALVYQVMKCMHDEDFSLRQASSRVMNNFVRAVGKASNTELDKVYLAETTVVPQIKEGLKTQNAVIRKGFLVLLAEVAKSFTPTETKQYPLLHLDLKHLFDEDKEQDVFSNLMHVQPHRRARALVQLRKRIDKLEANTITSIFLPMIMHNLHEADKGSENVLIQESILTIQAIAATLPWSRYSSILRTIMSQIQKYPSREKLLIKSIEGVIDAFHFDMSDGIQKFLVETLLPLLNGFLVEKSEDAYAPMQALRVPIALSVVKVLKKLPVGALEEHLLGLLSTICGLLKSKEQRTRNEAKLTLVKLLNELGVQYVDTVITELRRSLREGFMLHVLGNVIHAMLVSLPENVILDKPASQIVEVMTEDIFGDVAKQRGRTSGYVPSQDIQEAQSCKSYSTYQILAARITFQTHIHILTKPLETVGRRNRPVPECKEVLKHLTIGLSRNPTFTASTIVDYCLDLINQHLDEHLGYEDLWIGYSVDLLNMALKRRIITSKTEEHRQLLDRCVKLLVKCCQKCKSNYVLSASLKCLSSMITWDLPSISAAVQDILDQIFRMLRMTSSGSGGKEVRQSCFRTIALLLRKTKLKVSDARMRVIISLAEADLHHMLSQNATFSLIKAILSRRIILVELYDLVTKITKLMITSLKPAVRHLCSQVFMEFLENYPMGNKRREEHINALLKNLSYSFEVGRISALNMLEKILKKASEEAINAQAKTFFVQLVLRLVNEDMASCREKISAVMHLLLCRAGSNEFEDIVGMTKQWINVLADTDESRLMCIAALQCFGFQVKSRPKLMQKHLVDYQVMIKQTNSTKQKHNNNGLNSVVHWEIIYHSMLVVEKILNNNCNVSKFLDNDTFDVIVLHLSSEHPWVRTVTMRVLQSILSSTKLFKLKPIKGMICDSKRIFEITRNLCYQFKHENMPETMAELGRNNLMLIAKVFIENCEGQNDVNGSSDNNTNNRSKSSKSNDGPVHWAIHRLSYCIRAMKTAAIPARHGILRWYMDMVSQYKRHVIKSVVPILACSYRIATAREGQQNISKETITLGQEVMDALQEIMDEEVYTKHVEDLRKEIFSSRQDRKRKRELEKITDPEAAAARRVKKNLHKRKSRKRKMEQLKNNRY